MLPRNIAPDNMTTAVVAASITKSLSGVHATTSSTAVPLWSQLHAPPPKEVESVRIAQFVATVVVAIHDAYTCGGGEWTQRNR